MITFVRAASLTNYAELFRAMGGDPDKALRQAGLRPSVVLEQDQLIDALVAGRLLEDAAASTGCENFGLRMAQSRQISNFGVVSLLLLHQPTLRKVLTTLIEHVHMLNESLVIQMEDANGVVVLREEFTLPEALTQSMELAIGVLFRTCNLLLNDRWRPQQVCFTHHAPRDLSLHKQLFRCRVEFDADFNGIVFRTEDLDAPNPWQTRYWCATHRPWWTPASRAARPLLRSVCARPSTSCCHRAAPPAFALLRGWGAACVRCSGSSARKG